MSIRPCIFRFTYIWLENGKGFWFFPTLIGRHSIAGYRWQKNIGSIIEQILTVFDLFSVFKLEREV